MLRVILPETDDYVGAEKNDIIQGFMSTLTNTAF